MAHVVRFFSLVCILAHCHVKALVYTQHRPQQPQCRATLYYSSSFAISDPGTATTTTYCHAETGFVPNTYQQPRQGVQALTEYSLWAIIANTASPSELNTQRPCTQQAKSMLCAGLHETPLFIMGPSNSEFECRCDEGFFQGNINGKRECFACEHDAFCPIHTNLQFKCPPNSHAIITSPDVHTKRSLQRLLGLAVEDAYCMADAGYVLRHAHPDISALVRATLTFDTVDFYTTTLCEPACFGRVLCGSVVLARSFHTLCAPGEFMQSDGGGSFLCTICPANSFCTGGVQYACKQLQYTYATGHSNATDCRCRAGTYLSVPNPTAATDCVAISSPDYYSTDCVASTDQTCGIQLACPRGSLCRDGFIVAQCAGGETMDAISRKCVACPLGFYCVDGVSVLQCPPGATTSLTRAIDATDCFCVSPFVAVTVTGTAQGFVCQMPTHDASNSSMPSATVRGGVYYADAHIAIDTRYSKLYVEHQAAGAVMHTVVVLNATSRGLVVYLFVNDTAGVRVVSSHLSLESTAVADALELFNSVLSVASVDFTEFSESGLMTLHILIMDTLQGLVYRGAMRIVINADAFELAVFSQEWTLLFEFGAEVFYTTLSVPVHYALVACQTRSSIHVAADPAVQNDEPGMYSYYDIVRMDLQQGSTTITTFKSATPFDRNKPPALQMDMTYEHVSLRDPAHVNDIICVHFVSWQPLSTGVGIAGAYTAKQRHVVMLSATMLVPYRALLRQTLVFAQHINGISLGIVKIDYRICAAGAWASAASFFQCVCLPGYQPRQDTAVPEATAGCIACSPREACYAARFAAENASKCEAGHRLLGSHCLRCSADEYCQHGQRHVCPANSWTENKLGSVDSTVCVCRPGFYAVAATNNTEFSCQMCSRPFYCTDSQQRLCPANSSTTTPKAMHAAQCECWPGFTLSDAVVATCFCTVLRDEFCLDWLRLRVYKGNGATL